MMSWEVGLVRYKKASERKCSQIKSNSMKMTSAADFGIIVLILCGMEVSLAVRHVTVMEGERLTLQCPEAPGNMDWHRKQNNKDVTLFFDHIKAYKDSRYSIHNFSSSDYTLMASPVSLKDEGMYECHHYHNTVANVTTKRFNVTVLGKPKITYTEHENSTIVKCSVNGRTPLKLSWRYKGGIEVEAQPQHTQQDKTGRWTTEDVIRIRILKRKIIVRCILHHPGLPHAGGVTFETIENKKFKLSSTTTSSTETSTWSTSASLTTDSPHFKITGETDYTEITSMTTSQSTDTNINTTSTQKSTNSLLVNTSSTSDNTTSITENGIGNYTKGVYEKPSSESREGGSASLFISSVTALIICLMIVVTFLLVKMRRAHQKYKSEKEESDQSVESGKSKSSGEESKPKVSLGFLKSNFRKYKVDVLGKQTSASTSASTLASSSASASVTPSHSTSHTVEVTVENHLRNAILKTQDHSATPSPVKETEL
ncbi:cytotoxic and regulatory T-cell molecule [Clupea harengus]|uniref:Cytotoxic and regulatory T-cell molecule n=1 Tax=Clupea harengus TaxID=7950 RepID=A0A6P8FHZ7_CLUHA|nr:cytotoxic and regulatory T-cell molecule [Clupea harengus]